MWSFVSEILSVFAGLIYDLSDELRQVNPRVKLAIILVLQKGLFLILNQRHVVAIDNRADKPYATSACPYATARL